LDVEKAVSNMSGIFRRILSAIFFCVFCLVFFFSTWNYDLGNVKLKSHPFFNGIPFEKLHESHPPSISSGKIAPTKNKLWSRRKYSVLNAPLPQAYNFAEKFKMEIILEGKEDSSCNSNSNSNSNSSSSSVYAEQYL